MQKALTTTILFITTVIANITTQAKGGPDTVIHNGRTFVVTPARLDTVEVSAPSSIERILEERYQSRKPLSMNGIHIYNEEEIKTSPKFIVSKEAVSFEQYYINMLASEWQKLPDGIYGLQLSPLVIDESGNIVYHHIHTLQRIGLQSYPRTQEVGEDTVIAIERKSCEVLCKPRLMTPAVAGETNVVATFKSDMSDYRIVVKNGSFTFSGGNRYKRDQVDHHMFRSK